MSVTTADLQFQRTALPPWLSDQEDERRFRRILLWVGIPFLILGLVLPHLPLPERAPPPVAVEPPRYTQLVLRPTPPPPPPEVKAQPAPRNEVAAPTPRTPPKPTPRSQEAPSAREQAQRSGLLAMRDSLKALQSQPSSGKLSQGPLSVVGGDAPRTERSLLTAKVGSGTEGINTSSLSRDTGGGGGSGLGGRNVAQVTSPIGTTDARGSAATGSRNKRAGRTDEEIQLVFDRNKSAIYALYNRALREKPTLQGKLVLRLTIAPSGEVLNIGIVSSDLRDADLEQKLTLRVKRFDFGAKDVDTVTVTYPIEFFPS